MDIKEVKFENHVSPSNMTDLVGNAEKRAREGVNEIPFLTGEAHITSTRAQIFKKLKFTTKIEAASPIEEIIKPKTSISHPATKQFEKFPESSAAQMRSKKDVLSFMTIISGALENDSSLSSSKRPLSLNTRPSAKAPRTMSSGSAPRQLLISSPNPSNTDTKLDSAGDILAFKLNGMNISSNWSAIAQSQFIETAESPLQGGWCPNTALSLKKSCEQSLSSTLELQQKARSIAKGLIRTEKSLEHCTGALTDRENLIKRAALRALIDSYQNQITLLQKATQDYLTKIEFVRHLSSDNRQWILLRYREKLGQLSDAGKKRQETEFCHSEARTVAEMSFGFDDGLKYRTFLASTLSEISREEEALNLLLGGFKDYLSTRLSPVGSGPFSRIIFKQSLPQKIRSESFMQMTKLIQLLHWKTDHNGSLTGAIAKLACIQELVRTDLDFPHLADEAVVIGAMGLACEYSQVSLFYKADLVYAFAVPELLRLRDKWYSFSKASELKDYAQHCQRSNKWIASLEVLEITFKYMGLLKGHPDKLDEGLITALDKLGTDFRQHWLSKHESKSKEASGYAALKNARSSRSELAAKLNVAAVGSE